jgi:hypothetical protein
MTAAALIQVLKNVNVANIAVKAVKQTQTEYLNIQTQKQMLYGINATGNKISPSYTTAAYSRQKQRFNPRPGYGVPDLRKSGDLYEETKFLKVDETQIEIESQVPYAKYVERRYGDKIYGLSPKNRSVYAFGPFFKAFKKQLESLTGLVLK